MSLIIALATPILYLCLFAFGYWLFTKIRKCSFNPKILYSAVFFTFF